MVASAVGNEIDGVTRFDLSGYRGGSRVGFRSPFAEDPLRTRNDSATNSVASGRGVRQLAIDF